MISKKELHLSSQTGVANVLPKNKILRNIKQKMTYLICPHIFRISCGGLAQYHIGVRQGLRLCANLLSTYYDANDTNYNP